MIAEFQFNIGNLVVTKVGIADARLSNTKPLVFQVVYRIVTESDEGVEYSYGVVRAGSFSEIDEVELVLLFDYEKGHYK